MRAANILHLGIKELRGLGRDPVLLILIVHAFTLAIYTASKAMPETLNRAPIAIVDEDRSALSARISGAFYPPYFLAPSLISQQEMDSRMDAGLDTFALADERRAGQHDRQHGDGCDDVADRAEPTLVQFRIEAGAQVEGSGQDRLRAVAGEEFPYLARYDRLHVATAGESL